MRAIAPNREDRFPTAADFRDALQGALRGLGPISLRDLGAVLGKTFSAERQRLRTVIEEQFRLMDSGNPPPDTQALPSVSHVVTNTMSESVQRSLEKPRPPPAAPTTRPPPHHSVRRDAGDLATDDSLRPTRSNRSRRLTVALATGVLTVTVAALGAVGARMLARPAIVPDPPTLPMLDAGPPAISSQTAVATPPSVPDVLPVSSAPLSPAAASTHAGTSGRPYSYTSRPSEARTPPAPIIPAPSTPVPTAAPTPPATANPDSPLPPKNPKPKVQLERDNPWP